MPIPQQLTDEQAAAIWSGDTASLLGFEDDKVETVATATETKTDPEEATKTEPTIVKTPVKDEDLSSIWRDDDEEDKEDEEKEEPKADPAKAKPTTLEPTTTLTEKVKGRKPSDLVTMVNQLVKDELLIGFEDAEEITTIEEAKQLIEENLKDRENIAVEDVWKRKVESYSPQVQAILHYAEKGGKDITPLLGAISEVEQSANIDVSNEEGQEEIVRQIFKLKGLDDEEIKDQIETLKDLDKLKSKAEKFLPELNRMKEERINMLMKEQEQRDSQAKDAARVYIQTVQQTLDKDTVGELKLKREDKSKIIGALAEAKYRSIGGYTVNEFVKTLEELQFGKNANYEHFLNIVHLTVDKKGFIDKLKETIKNEVTADQVRKLKSAKSTSANTAPEETSSTDNSRRVIKKEGFRNPYQ